MFQPKIIERDFQCKSKHSQPIQSVILDQSIPKDQKLICKECENTFEPNVRIIEYQLLKQLFDNQQKEKIKQYEIIIAPHINVIKALQDTITTLKTRLIQLLDHLLWLSSDWINTMIELITSYSFFEQIDNFTSSKETVIDTTQLIDKTKKIHTDWKIKINLKLQLFKICPEFKQCLDLIDQLERLTNKQEDEFKSQLINNKQENLFIPIFQQKITNQQSQGVWIVEDLIYKTDTFGELYLQKKLFQINKTEKQIIYTTYDGRVIRSDQICKKPKILKKWEQILNLQWLGEYGPNSNKIGLWTATWNKEKIQGIGGEYTDGKKEGYWVEMISNFCSQGKAFKFGLYEDNKRKGIWKYKYRDNEIGGGVFNQFGLRIGKWIELFKGFWDYSQVTYNGEYNMNGKKVGRWNTVYEGNNIGGGLYDSDGNQKQIGYWIELDEQFYDKKQVTYRGEYNMNGLKVGRWNIMYDRLGNGEQKQMQILSNYKEYNNLCVDVYSGGGFYDQEGSQRKIGNWVDLFEGFYYYAQVIYYGQYNIEGMKVGRWDLVYYDPFGEYKQIGGGFYDQNGKQKKIRKWIELYEGFYDKKQITFEGEYNLNGMKVGKWNILKQNVNIHKDKENIMIRCVVSGGGSYDKEGNQQKLGKWIELDEEFQDEKQITCKGKYFMNGMKKGRWDIFYDIKGNGQNKQILIICSVYKNSGGGFYDQNGKQKKIGKWVELFEKFKHDAQIIYNGEYNLNGMKIGQWDIRYCKYDEQQYKLIGGGLYDSYGNQIKIGKWIELDEGFYEGPFNSKKVLYNGEYNLEGMKIGIWMEMDLKDNNHEQEM